MQKDDKPSLVIIRGVPGSGKTTLAKSRYPDHVLVEADQFFEKNGKYEFDMSRIWLAHKWCYEKVKKELLSGKNVVVANTFIHLKDMDKYIELNVPTKIVTAKGRFKNVHGVPEDIVEQRRKDFQPINEKWLEKHGVINGGEGRVEWER